MLNELGGSPAADGIEVLEAESQWVDAGMAAGTLGFLAVDFQLPAKTQPLARLVIGGKLPGIRRRWRGTIAEE